MCLPLNSLVWGPNHAVCFMAMRCREHVKSGLVWCGTFPGGAHAQWPTCRHRGFHLFPPSSLLGMGSGLFWLLIGIQTRTAGLGSHLLLWPSSQSSCPSEEKGFVLRGGTEPHARLHRRWPGCWRTWLNSSNPCGWVGCAVQMGGQEWGDGNERASRCLQDLDVIPETSFTSYVS